MDDKKLDINQPLLTVRRFSSTQNSEKNVKKNDHHPLNKLLPLPRHHFTASGPVSIPGRVPFLWEESPGRPKNEGISQPEAHQDVPNIPKPPPGKTPKGKKKERCHEKFPSISECASSLERDSEELEEGDLRHGLSGFDDSEMKRSSSFLMDSQARDFMMGRFLPAAKDLASVKPRYVYRQQQRKVTDTMSVDKSLPVHRPKGKEEEEITEAEDNDYREPENVSTRIRMAASYVRKSRPRSSSSSSLEEMKNELNRPAIIELASGSRLHKNKLENETTKSNKNGLVRQLKKSSSQRIHGNSGKELHNIPQEAGTDEFSCLISLERSSNSYQKFLATQNPVGSLRPVLVKKVTSQRLKSVSENVAKVDESEENPYSGSISKSINEGSSMVDEDVASESFSVKLDEKVGVKDCADDEGVEDRKQLSKVENVQKFQDMDMKSPLPPLPKSPSESWLWRTKMNHRYQASRYAHR